MSPISATLRETAHTADEPTQTLGNCPGTYAMSLFSPPGPDRIPLSLRTSHELWTRSEELARMAATARTADARVALETLAARFAELAAKREAAEDFVPKIKKSEGI